MWDFYYTYRANANWLAKLVMPGQMHKMRIWDKCAADRVDYFIANSHYIAQRIKKYYRRDSDVIYPCCHINEVAFCRKGGLLPDRGPSDLVQARGSGRAGLHAP